MKLKYLASLTVISLAIIDHAVVSSELDPLETSISLSELANKRETPTTIITGLRD